MHLSWSGKNDLLGTCCEMGLHLRWRKGARDRSLSVMERERGGGGGLEVRGKLGSRGSNHFIRSQECSSRLNHVFCPFAKDAKQNKQQQH